MFMQKVEKGAPEPLLSNQDCISVISYACTEVFCFFFVFWKVRCLSCKSEYWIESKFT